jgi:hypothetical protein
MAAATPMADHNPKAVHRVATAAAVWMLATAVE